MCETLVSGVRHWTRVQKTSRIFYLPWNTVKAFISKWRKWGTKVTLQRTGRPSKIDERTRWKLIRKAAKRPRATLNELQGYLASTSQSLHVRAISHIPPPPKKNKPQTNKKQKHPSYPINHPKQCGKMYSGLMRPRWNLRGIILDMFVTNTHFITQRNHTHWEA